MPPDTIEITELLDAWSGGDPDALERLIPLVIDDLRRIARSYLIREQPGHTLEPTALVNELYMRLAGRRTVTWESRTQFFASMAEIMRRILVDHARRRKAQKKGGGATPHSFEESNDHSSLWGPAIRTIDVDLVALHEALERLEVLDQRQARLVELRYFGGLTIAETARTLECSLTTVKREWNSARLWLLRELRRVGEKTGPPGT